ncbi:hypothetical protein HXX76_013002 [Chlamydomonas incerta]|uniref:Disease resistance R13L4/SHOC-2-like LRR domain-containing protein n=1 Tax=Chlamydomonas incerta TaxID=51695 RepID=A0A835SQ81_CHLIN|nr:hypothetical protein HXX76_013002 [Chlamydomonas incerta]|eukprot:KAG2426244.1 hypothetical protein HXX76_013002 [Chlamydomonas incerta]
MAAHCHLAGAGRAPRGWLVHPYSAHVAPSARRSTGALRSVTVVPSAYSRSSWRDAILEEQGEQQQHTSSVPVADGAANGDSALSSRDNGETAAASTGGLGSDTAYTGHQKAVAPCGLSAAELRVKLSLATGSGRLDLTDARLSELPAEVAELTELEELQLSGNCLTRLPDFISRLTALRRLGLAGNLLTELPPGLGALTALEGLWLHGNLLTSLPPQLGQLGALRALSLAGNCISQLPPGCLSGLTSLTDLTLAGNRLTELPPGELAPLAALRKLALNGNKLGQGRDTATQGPLPLGVGRHMGALQELMLQGNCLGAVEASLFDCPALTELSLADNRLTHLPDRLSGATRLARLHLFGNRLQRLAVRQLAGLPALSTVWLEGNAQLPGPDVAALVGAAGLGGMPALKALGLDQGQLAAMRQQGMAGDGSAGGTAASGEVLPRNVRVGSVLDWYGPGPGGGSSCSGDGDDGGGGGGGPGYFKLQYGPQRPGGTLNGAGSSNDVLVVAFGSAPGTPNWGGLLGKVYKAAQSAAESYFDVLYVADPCRDWYGGGSEAAYTYYRARLAATTSSYRRVLLLGDSMGATACLLFADLATAALAFCPQVDLTTASIRPGRPAAWFAALKQRLMASVAAFGDSGGDGSSDGLPAAEGARGGGQLVVLVGTWAHDLDQANMLPQAAQQNQKQAVADASAAGRQQDRARRAARSAGWRDAGGEPGPIGAALHRSPWAWQQEVEVSGAAGSDRSSLGAAGGVSTGATGTGGVVVKVFNVDSHRLAAALDAQGQLMPLIRSAVLEELSLRGAIVRVANLL